MTRTRAQSLIELARRRLTDSPERRTHRRGTDPYTSCMDLALPWAEWRADPNGYYGRLGLPTDRAVLMWEIRAAYLTQMRAHHPDAGGDDPEALERSSVAYSVLSRPATRRAYDQLPEGTLWLQGDRFAQAEERERADARLRGAAVDAEHLQQMRDLLQQAMAEAISTDPEQAPITEEDDPPPTGVGDWIHYVRGGLEPTDVCGWLHAAAVGWRAYGHSQEVLVGFHDGGFEWEREPWGDVMWVPARSEPSGAVAIWMVREVFGA